MPTSLRIALAFLTRLPVAAPTASPAALASATAFFPLVGAALGACVFATQALITPAAGSLVAAVLGVTLLALLTGGLHLDGVADLFDALGGGRGARDRMLELMRDPRVGAHGASAIALVVIAKVVLMSELIVGDHAHVLILAPAFARLLPVLLFRAFPYARQAGLGHAFHTNVRARHLLWALLSFGALLAVLSTLGTLDQLRALATPDALGMELQRVFIDVVPALIVGACALLLCRALSRRLGGLTGDVHGAAIELGEVGYALCAVLLA